MPLRIEDYGLIGDLRTAALVGSDGSIDWLCVPRLDAGACFAALLGTPENGRWLLAPATQVRQVRRRYRPGTLILETDFETADGRARVIDLMPPDGGNCHVIRIVEGLEGRVAMRMELVVRFDYGAVVPWVRRVERGVMATAGPDTLELQTPVATRGEDLRTLAEFDIARDQRVPFVLTYRASHDPPQTDIDPERSLQGTEKWWQEWSARCTFQGRWREPVMRSLVTLKALTYAPTGGIVAAPTTSLPEQLHGPRNWDYRYCWLRDATFTLYALLFAGYRKEAGAWREWLLRAVAGSPRDMQILYGIAGERRMTEMEIGWLPGYEGSAPVRVGNGATPQLQLDVYGEIMDAFHLSRAAGIEPESHAWAVQRALLDFLESQWQHPDHGIWEIRGPRQHFTHSKVMAWVAFDRAAKAVSRFGLDGPVERWRALREEIHQDVCRSGFNPNRNAFVQHYGSRELDASLLMIPLVGFLPADDPRMRGTIDAIAAELMNDGLVCRYATESGVDGLPPGEGAFLPCSFWLVDNLAMLGRQAEAEALYERLLALRNDLGLIAEEYDPREKRMLGNFPQAMTHVALINSARNLAGRGGPSEHRSAKQ